MRIPGRDFFSPLTPTARIRRFYPPESWNGVRLVDLIQEDTSWFSIFPGTRDDLFEHFRSGHLHVGDLVARVIEVRRTSIYPAQRVPLAAEITRPRLGRPRHDLPHKVIGEADRDVEILERPLDTLDVDKLEDVGVIASHDRHIR